jgi:hypothetical protein
MSILAVKGRLPDLMPDNDGAWAELEPQTLQNWAVRLNDALAAAIHYQGVYLGLHSIHNSQNEKERMKEKTSNIVCSEQARVQIRLAVAGLPVFRSEGQGEASSTVLPAEIQKGSAEASAGVFQSEKHGRFMPKPAEIQIGPADQVFQSENPITSSSKIQNRSEKVFRVDNSMNLDRGVIQLPTRRKRSLIPSRTERVSPLTAASSREPEAREAHRRSMMPPILILIEADQASEMEGLEQADHEDRQRIEQIAQRDECDMHSTQLVTLNRVLFDVDISRAGEERNRFVAASPLVQAPSQIERKSGMERKGESESLAGEKMGEEVGKRLAMDITTGDWKAWADTSFEKKRSLMKCLHPYQGEKWRDPKLQAGEIEYPSSMYTANTMCQAFAKCQDVLGAATAEHAARYIVHIDRYIKVLSANQGQ